MVSQRKSKAYTKEFKDEAVRLLRVSGKSANQLSQELGIQQSSLSRWKRQADERDAVTPQDLVQEEEIRQLRKELNRVRMGRDILKKATVYSIGQCNILHTNLIIGDVAHGSDGTTRIVRATEVGGMASMEERPVAQRYWSSAREASGVDSWYHRRQWGHRTNAASTLSMGSWLGRA